jgi:hypothetical protein
MTSALDARPQAAEQEPLSPRPRRKRKSDKAGYVFLLPWFGGVLLTFVPFFISLYLAFTDYDLLTAPKFTGLDNIKTMLADQKLHQALGVTFTYTFISVPISLAAALLVAVVLNKGMRGLPIYRSIYYLPSLLGGSVAIVMLWRAIFGASGIVNHILGFFGIEHGSWIQNPDTALGVLVSLEVWSFGSPMVIFLAAPTGAAGALRGRGRRRGTARASVLVDHAADDQSRDLLQPGAVAHRRPADLHPGVRRLGRNGRTRGLDDVLQPVPVPAGVPELQHGLRLRDGLAAAADHRRLHRNQLLRPALLGALRELS